MLKHSSGVLVYRYIDNELQVLLCHMGGPYWKNVEYGSWSIPKGETKNEKSIDTAIREFQEETSFQLKKSDLQFLGSKKQASHKLVTIFTTENNFDESKAFSNKFSIEWPKGSGLFKEFPEMDQAKWMNLEESKKRILNGQVYFLNKLERNLKND